MHIAPSLHGYCWLDMMVLVTAGQVASTPDLAPTRNNTQCQVSCVYHSEEAENQYLLGNEGGREGLFGGAKPPPAAAGGKPGGGAE